MTTDDLIAAIGAEPSPVHPTLVQRALAVGLGAGLAVAALAFALLWGPRPDIEAVAGDLFLIAKTGLPLLLGLAALPLALARGRPAGKSRSDRAIWMLPAVVIGLMGIALLDTPSTRWPGEFFGESIATCLVSIPILSAPVLAGLLQALRRGAPEHPWLCGAAAGLVAAGFGAALYSLYCDEDSPLFYGTWYLLAIGIVVAIGALLGRVRLRW